MAQVKSERFSKGIILKADDVAIESVEGALKVGLTSKELHAYLDGASRTIVTTDQAQALTNKDVNADENTISNLEVDNLKAGVLNTSTTMSGATDSQVPSALAIKTYIDDKAAAQNQASEISFAPAGTIAATDVQTMGVELDSDIQALQSELDTEEFEREAADIILQDNIEEVQTNLENHINDTIEAHAASAIANTPSGNISSTNQQAVNNELQADIDTINTTSIPSKVNKAASSTDNAIARYDGTDGGTVQNSSVIIDDANAVSGITNLQVDNINIDGSTITGSTATIGIGSNIVLTSATETHVGRIAYTPTSDATSGTDVTITPGTNKTIKLTNSGLISISAIDGLAPGQEVILVNKTGNDVTINNDSGANGVYTGTGNAVTLKNNGSFTLTYDFTATRWHLVGGTGSGGGQTTDVFVQLVADEQVAVWSSGNNATFLGGGTIQGTFARETSSPLNGTASYKYTQAAGSLNDYLASPVQDVPIRFRGNQATISFPYLYNGNNDDIALVVYDVTNSNQLTVSSTTSLDATSLNTSKFATNVFIPLTCTQIRVGFQTLVANNGKILQFDDLQIGADATVFANINQIQSSYLSTNTSFSGGATVTGAATRTNGSGIFSYNSSTGIYTILKQAEVTLTYTNAAAGAASVAALIKIGSTIVASDNSLAAATANCSTAFTEVLNVGDTFSFAVAANSANGHLISVTAIAPNTNIVAQPETFSTDTAALTYAGSSTYTLPTLANAPVGTFITFTYAINTNTRTQTTTAPTQTTADMNTNGILLYTRPHNAASTAAQPAAIAIQIGKGMKGVTQNFYKSTGKTTSGSLDASYVSTTVSTGFEIKEYNEVTGILLVDAGYRSSSAITSPTFLFSDISGQTNGYLTINASKNPALTGIGAAIVAARAINTVGTTVQTTDTTLVYDSSKTYDTTNSLVASTGIFTCPVAGYYQANAGALVSSTTYTVDQALFISFYKNGATVSQRRWNAQTTSAIFLQGNHSDIIFLNRNDTLEVKLSSSKAATTLSTSAGYNFFSIAKINVG